MAAGAPVQSWDQPSRRRGVRYRVQVPLEVTVLRSGIPDRVPGRAVNLGEGGVAAMLAGELLPGEAVGVDIRLPLAPGPLRTRALVKHQARLCCGMQFLNLSSDQRNAIRDFARAAKAEPEPRRQMAPLEPERGSENVGSGNAQPPMSWHSRRGWTFFWLSTAILIAVLWWHWNRAWADLESGLPKNDQHVATIHPQAHVPSEVMEKLVTHRVDPDYPAAARADNLQGVILVDVIVGREGSVVEMHALNGPEVLARAAMDALRWWRFQPYRANGQPEVVETTVAVEFKP